MQLSSKDPDIQTILSWIRDQRIDLEPDFQRGEVWNVSKKQLLIDTILRNWQMPPIFIIIDDHSLMKNVLDGHQRLTAIYQFSQNEFSIDGYLHPLRQDIKEFDGLFFRNLPERERRKFLDFSIRIFEISNHERDEPFELFYRLNEGVKLTPAERRNTFYGALKGQVKRVVEFWESISLGPDQLGFANARLAYHDVIARTLILLEKRDLSRKLTDKEITERYRRESGVNDEAVSAIRQISVGLSHALQNNNNLKFSPRHKRLSKPTLFSILYFFGNLQLQGNFTIDEETIQKFLFVIFEMHVHLSAGDRPVEMTRNEELLYELFEFYRYRSSTSVNDARALLIRDYFINFVWDYLGFMEQSDTRYSLRNIATIYKSQNQSSEDLFFEILQAMEWGRNARS
jgi:hypothetical protein